MRLAWFSPMPPVPSGIAVCSAELVDAFAAEHEIDVFEDDAAFASGQGLPRRSSSHGQERRRGLPRRSGGRSAHEFVWRHRRRPYDLAVYQLGNSSHHDYLWPYLFRYPGLAVLHDAHLHHARAAALLRTKRADDYRAEFAANHPEVHPDLAELTVAGFDNHLYYAWPMTRLLIQRSRVTAVHSPVLAANLSAELPGARIEAIRLAHGAAVGDDRAREARGRVRIRYGLGADAVLFGVFGGLTPEKRLPQLLDALAAILPYAPHARLLLAGAPAAHYDVAADVRARGLESYVTITGYLDKEDELTDAIAASDVALNLRWPTAREVSGPWLRSLAAGKPTVTMDLTHLTHVPSIDPRTWKPNISTDPRAASCELRAARESVTIAIDILDEDHSLRLAMRRLAADGALRESLGAAGQRYWQREHSINAMVEDYRRAIARAAAEPEVAATLPPHLVNDGDHRLMRLFADLGIERDAWT